MGRKSAAKRRVYDGEATPALRKHVIRGKWHELRNGNRVRGIVASQETILSWKTGEMKPELKPVLHHMSQYHELLHSRKQYLDQPMSHLKHRLFVKRYQDGYPIYGFRSVITAHKRRQDRCFPRGKAYKRVAHLETGVNL